MQALINAASIAPGYALNIPCLIIFVMIKLPVASGISELSWRTMYRYNKSKMIPFIAPHASHSGNAVTAAGKVVNVRPVTTKKSPKKNLFFCQ